MNRIVATGLIVLAFAGCATMSSTPPTVQLSEDARAHPEHYVVVTVHNAPVAMNTYAASTPRGYSGTGAYRASADAIALARGVAADHKLSEVASWPIELLGVHCLVYQIPSGAERGKLLAALRHDPRVETAEPLSPYELHASSYDDPYADLQRNLDDMGVAAAQQWSQGGSIKIAVIDTGVDTTHPDFAGRLVSGGDFVGDGRPSAEGHGTAVAGIIAAVPNNRIGIAGMAPDAKVISFRACWSAGRTTGACNSFTLAQALVAALKADASIMNLSLGGPGDALLDRIVRRGLQRGTVFVGAVPTSGRREGFPTGIDGVIAVDVAERPERVPHVLYAPGTDVFTLSPQGHYDAASGSSVAAAEVTGIAALLLARRPALTAGEVEDILTRSMPRGDASARVATGVNACVALRDLLQSGECPDAAALARAR
jgi:subtilisin family serine protease